MYQPHILSVFIVKQKGTEKAVAYRKHRLEKPSSNRKVAGTLYRYYSARRSDEGIRAGTAMV